MRERAVCGPPGVGAVACYRGRVRIAVVIPALEEAEQIADAIESVGAEAGSDSRLDPALAGDSLARSGRAGRELRVPRAGPVPLEGEAELAEKPRAGDAPQRQDEAQDSKTEVEIWVVDGGSRDDTATLAEAAGARVLQSEPSRSRQMQMGWQASRGEVVLFLHADTRLEAGWDLALCQALGPPDVAGGAFRFRFDRTGLPWRLLEWGVWLRVKLFALPYGDQAIFVRRDVLEAMGGVPPVALMEDLDLVAAMKAHGRIVEVPLHATTSARRYVEAGVLRTVARHALALVAWRLGVDRASVARWLRR